MDESFTEKVYAAVKRIPKGKVATYKQIAVMSGNSSAARAVGRCMKTNSSPHIIPCHRVVASTGMLTGYAFGNGIATKRNLLIDEGVLFVGERVLLRVSQWNPPVNL